MQLRPARPVPAEGMLFARFMDQAAEGFYGFLLGSRSEAIVAAAFLETAVLLARFPGGACAGTPMAIDARDCSLARRQDTEGAWRAYISEHPGGLCIDHALDQLPQDEEEGLPLPESPFVDLERAALVRVEAPVVLGALGESAVVQVLDGARPELGRCYAEALVLNPDLEGRLEVRFLVGADGRASRVRTRASSLEHGGVEACAVRVLEYLGYAPPPSRAVVTVGVRFSAAE